MKTYALHGMLGLPSDWRQFDHEMVAVDYFKEPILPFHAWAAQFNAQIKGGGHLLLGYSLGARLAMHLLLDDPRRWKGAVLISGHPGLPEVERAARKAKDAAWARRFENEPWEDLMHAWNSQPILQTSAALQRLEHEFKRTQLSHALLEWSLGKQEDLHKPLEQLQIPILWIRGERDPSSHPLPNGRHWICPDAGHRVPWDNPVKFLAKLKQFTTEEIYAVDKSMANASNL